MESRKEPRNKVKTRPGHNQPLPTSITSRAKVKSLIVEFFTVRRETIKPPHNKIGVIPCKIVFAN